MGAGAWAHNISDKSDRSEGGKMDATKQRDCVHTPHMLIDYKERGK